MVIEWLELWYYGAKIKNNWSKWSPGNRTTMHKKYVIDEKPLTCPNLIVVKPANRELMFSPMFENLVCSKTKFVRIEILDSEKIFRNSFLQNMSLEFGHQVDILIPCQNFSFFSIEFQMWLHPIQVVLPSNWLGPTVAPIFFVAKAHRNFQNYH